MTTPTERDREAAKAFAKIPDWLIVPHDHNGVQVWYASRLNIDLLASHIAQARADGIAEGAAGERERIAAVLKAASRSYEDRAAVLSWYDAAEKQACANAIEELAAQLKGADRE